MNPTTRPAEWSGAVAGAVALLAGQAFDLDADAVGALAIIVGFIPAGVTAIVTWARGMRKSA